MKTEPYPIPPTTGGGVTDQLAVFVAHENGISDRAIADTFGCDEAAVSTMCQEAAARVSTDPSAYRQLVALRHERDKVHAPAVLKQNAYWHEYTTRWLAIRTPRDLQSFYSWARPARTAPRSREARQGATATRGAARRSADRSGSSGDDDEPSPAPRLCSCGCGRSLEGKRRDALTVDGSCRMRLLRQRQKPTPEPLRPLGAQPCACLGHSIVLSDPDGDGVCLLCGRRSLLPLRGRRVNGYDATRSLMASNGVALT